MSAYYNEFDPHAAQWLRNLIAAGLIAPGYVDERSIKEVSEHDLQGFIQCHFFAGIGIWSYALRAAGFPDDRPVWTGSCPCQPFSAAGKGEGLDDPRHLWPDWFGLVKQRRPVLVLGEQVSGPDGIAWLDLARSDLEEHSYSTGALVACSAGVGGPDIRQRIYWMARAKDGNGWSELETQGARRGRTRLAGGGAARGLADADSERLDGIAIRLLAGGSQQAVSETSRRSEVGGVGHAASGGLGIGGSEMEPGSVRYPDGAGGELGRMGNASGAGLPQREREQRISRGASRDNPGQAAERGSVHLGGMADADGWVEGDGRLQRSGQHGFFAQDSRPGELDDTGRPGPLNGFWRDADWLFCTDGRWRPVEPGTFPLDTGIAGRLGALRAYGNGLNAQAARIFVESVMDLMP